MSAPPTYVLYSAAELATIPCIREKTTILVSGGLEPRRGIFPAWTELQPFLETRFDLDALAQKESWMHNDSGTYLIDLRHFIGSARDYYTADDPYERMCAEYPLITETLLQNLTLDVLLLPFLAILCKSGLRRSPSLLRELARRWMNPTHTLVLLHLSHIVRCDMSVTERF